MVGTVVPTAAVAGFRATVVTALMAGLPSAVVTALMAGLVPAAVVTALMAGLVTPAVVERRVMTAMPDVPSGVVGAVLGDGRPA